jgi:hypothetical protein
MTNRPGTLLPNITYRLDHPAEKLNRTRKRMYWSALAVMGLSPSFPLPFRWYKFTGSRPLSGSTPSLTLSLSPIAD